MGFTLPLWSVRVWSLCTHNTCSSEMFCDTGRCHHMYTECEGELFVHQGLPVHSYQCPHYSVSLYDSTQGMQGWNLSGIFKNQRDSNGESLTLPQSLTAHHEMPLEFVFFIWEWRITSSGLTTPWAAGNPYGEPLHVLPHCEPLPFWSSSHMMPERVFQKA